jgi:hypothetical protein
MQQEQKTTAERQKDQKQRLQHNSKSPATASKTTINSKDVFHSRDASRNGYACKSREASNCMLEERTLRLSHQGQHTNKKEN